ncbi:MAG: DUF401 family protein [Halanaerobiales bacterium]
MIPIAGIIAAFFLVIYLLSQNKSLAAAMFAGSVVVGLSRSTDWSQNFKEFFPTVYQGLKDPVTIELVVLVALVTIFAYLMKEMSLLNELINIARYYVNNLYLTISIIPSIIGMLPIPGGAILSAPIIAPVGKKLKMSGARLTSINIFYRHLWYFSFPYLPSLIIAASLSGINIYTIALMNLPIVILMLVIGWIYYTRTDNNRQKIKDSPKENVKEEEIKKPAGVRIVTVLLPFVLVLVPPIIFSIEFTTSLLLGIAFVIIVKRNEFKVNMILEGFNQELVLGVLGIMIFRTFIENSEGVYNITDILIEAGIPLLVLALVIPFLVGLLTGNHTGAIGISYPILLSLFQGSNFYSLWHMVIFSSSYFGYMLSPFHLCNLLTVEYFKTTLPKYYKDILYPFVTTMVGIVVLSLIYYNFL